MSARPDVELDRPHYVYRCYSESGDLLYIGVAADLGSRMFHHLHPCNRGKQPNGTLRRLMTDYSAERFETKVAARVAEREAIRLGAPLLNKQHNPLRFRKVAGGTYEAVKPVHPITAAAFEIREAAA